MEIYCYKLFLLTRGSVCGLSIESAETEIIESSPVTSRAVATGSQWQCGWLRKHEEQHLGDRNLDIVTSVDCSAVPA
jgi:hypothetical protein